MRCNLRRGRPVGEGVKLTRLRELLQSYVKGVVLDDDATLDRYSRDASLFEIQPKLVVQPIDTNDLKRLIAFVTANHQRGLSLTARSAGTDMTGGPLTESIVVDMTRHFDRVIEIGDGYAVVEPGVHYRDFDRLTAKTGQQLPCYPASRELCTVGGMVANNSGGEKTLTYGKTERYVKELNVVLADGNEYFIRPVSAEELEVVKQQDSFLGHCYARLHKLLEDNYDLIQAAKPPVSKNSSGYALWNIWNRETGIFDLTQLFVGSQGTLGFISKIKFGLIEPNERSRLLVIFLKDLSPLSQIVQKVMQFKPESFESYDDHTLKLAIRFFPEIAKRLKKQSFIGLLWQFLPEARMVLRHGLPKLVLLAEFTGDDRREVRERAEAAEAAIAGMGGETYLTQKRREQEKYWLVRRESFNLLRHHVKGKHTAPFIDDIVVRPEQLPEFLPALDKIMSQYRLIYTIAGHVGDANFHIIPLMNLRDPRTKEIIPELSEKVYDLVMQYRGSISGEHNDGLIRTPYLEKMYGPEICRLFAKTKKIFDPHNIFNPGKKVNSSLDYAMDHFIDDQSGD